MDKNNTCCWEDRKHLLAWAISFTKYKLNPKKILVESGLLSTVYEEVLLYRVVDCKCTVNLLQRLCGTGTVHLMTIDKSTPTIQLKNIKNPLKVAELISDLSVESRKENQLIEFVA